MSKSQSISLEETLQFLQDAGDTHILIHRSPDGDCIGAGYALCQVLRRAGKRVKVICNDPIPSSYHYLTECAPYGDTPEDFSPNTVIAVDVASPDMLGETLKETYAGRVDLSIDHHASRTAFSTYQYVDENSAATCEILEAMFKKIGIPLFDSLAQCLYTGIATDTGCFQFDNVRSETHAAAAHIMEACPNVPYAKLNRQLFVVKRMDLLKMESRLTDTMQSYLDGACRCITISYDFFDTYQIEPGELDGIPNFPLQIEGTEVGVTMKEYEPEQWRISMRSADKVDVAAICAAFGGGGHKKAAGCTLFGAADDVREKLVYAVKKGIAHAKSE